MAALGAQYNAQDPAGAAPYPPPGVVWYIVGVLTAGWTIAYIDRYIFGILIEPMRLALHLSDTQLSLLQGFAFALFFVVAGLPIGRLVDRHNRRNILLLGTICWSLATFACGLASGFWQLFFARLMVGVGEACLAPASISMVADLVSPRRRGLAMGVMFIGLAAGNGCSILLGGMILQAFGVAGVVDLPLLGPTASWQLVFFTVASPGFVLALVLLTLPEPVRRERVTQGAESGQFLRHLSRHKTGFALSMGAFAMNNICGIAIASWAPAVLMRVHHVPPMQIGLLMGSVMFTAGVVAPPLGGFVGDWLNERLPRLGRLGVPILGYPLLAVLVAGWWFQDSAAYTLLVFGLGAILIGGMVSANGYPAINQLAPNELRGQTMTLYLLVVNLAGFGVAPTAVAMMTDRVFHDPLLVSRSVVVVTVPCFIIGLVLSLLALKPYRRIYESALAAIAQKA